MYDFFNPAANGGPSAYEFYACGSARSYPTNRDSVRVRLLQDSASGPLGIPLTFTSFFYKVLPSDFDLGFWTNLHQEIQEQWAGRDGEGEHLVAAFILNRIIPEMLEPQTLSQF